MIAKFKIEDYKQRLEMCATLAEAGYPVWVEEINSLPSTHYVCVEVEGVELSSKEIKK